MWQVCNRFYWDIFMLLWQVVIYWISCLVFISAWLLSKGSLLFKIREHIVVNRHILINVFAVIFSFLRVFHFISLHNAGALVTFLYAECIHVNHVTLKCLKCCMHFGYQIYHMIFYIKCQPFNNFCAICSAIFVSS